MPGGLTYEQTKSLVDTLRKIQPNCLFSSRVGQGLGDYRDFGDSEVPARPIHGAWESIYTHNDSWGFIAHDKNFKSPKEIIQLLAEVASKGGNLMYECGSTRKRRYSYLFPLNICWKWVNGLIDSRRWHLQRSTYGLIPRQPWGGYHNQPEKLYLAIFLIARKPSDLGLPGMNVDISMCIS